jgi:hypothetical protein
MKRTGVISVMVFLLLFSSSAFAQPYKMALGIRIGSPDAVISSGATFKYFFKEKTAIETLLTFGDPFAVGLLVAHHQPFAATGLQWLAGGGGYVGFSGERRAGFQGVLGLDYKIANLPINFSVDWKPELTLTKEFSFEPAAVGFSARFTLK